MDLVTFTEEIRNGKLHFLCCVFEVNSMFKSRQNNYILENHVRIIEMLSEIKLKKKKKKKQIFKVQEDQSK